MTHCQIPYDEVGARYCDDCTAQDEGGFWTWETIGYECENFGGGSYGWVEGWYDSGSSMSQITAENDCADANDECSEWEELGNGGR